MGLEINIQHVYKFPVEMVMKAYAKIHKHQNEVQNIEELSTEQDNEMVCRKRILTIDNYFPSFFQRVKMLCKESIQVYEEIWVEPKERRNWVRARNLTWETDLIIGRTAYVSQHNNNEKWTFWDESVVLDFGGLGKLGIVLEFYLKRKIENKAIRDFKIMDNILRNSGG